MTRYTGTGWLPKDADQRTTGSGLVVLTFTLNAEEEGDAEPTALSMRLEDGHLIQKCGHLLTAGRRLTVSAKPIRLPITKGGGIVADAIVFLVRELELHSLKKADNPEPPTAAEKKPAPRVPTIKELAEEKLA